MTANLITIYINVLFTHFTVAFYRQILQTCLSLVRIFGNAFDNNDTTVYYRNSFPNSSPRVVFSVSFVPKAKDKLARMQHQLFISKCSFKLKMFFEKILICYEAQKQQVAIYWIYFLATIGHLKKKFFWHHADNFACQYEKCNGETVKSLPQSVTFNILLFGKTVELLY